MNEILRNARPPGWVWVALIVIGVALTKQYVTDSIFVEAIVIVAFMILKSLNLGTAELEQLLAIISRQQSKGDTRDKITRSTIAPAPGVPSPAETYVAPVDTEALRPNKMLRWMVG